MLWGAYAQKKGKSLDTKKHLVLKSVHPSPLSAHRGFFDAGHFRKANEYLGKHGKTPIDWSYLPAEEADPLTSEFYATNSLNPLSSKIPQQELKDYPPNLPIISDAPVPENLSNTNPSL
ncbi:hypothetical protein H4S08_004344 [Coemansia sp. RSA 1365]|nr:hypothetical protein H4S08_004344 [Coemansia sp. RSA 1365]